ncbi:MAG: DUF1223 domain-containing protein [Parvibaculaceae bacterium]
MKNAVTKAAITILLGTLYAASPSFAADKTPKRPVVVEYFTSQGCSSCPPADAFLSDDLSKRDDVLPLAFHVDYWDNLGWKDTFSQHGFTERQYAYKHALSSKGESAGRTGVYTPQMIVEGRFATVGSQRDTVDSYIKTARSTLANVTISITHDGDKSRLTIAADAGAAIPATLLLVNYQKTAMVDVKRGENAGHTITYANIVNSIEPIAHWNGKEVSVSLPEPTKNGTYVALLQADKTGPILGALRIE